MKCIKKELFFGLGFFEKSEGVALLLLLHVTEQQLNLAAVVSTGDVGVCDLCPSIKCNVKCPSCNSGSQQQMGDFCSWYVISVVVIKTDCDIWSLKWKKSKST